MTLLDLRPPGCGRAEPGPSIDEALGLLGFLAVVTAGACLGAAHAPWAAFPGAAAGFLVGVFVPAGVSLLGAWALAWVTPVRRPRCFAGRCGETDYEPLGGDGRAIRWRCRCGQGYVQRGTAFARDFGDGLELPYMTRDGWGRWTPAARRPRPGSVT